MASSWSHLWEATLLAKVLDQERGLVQALERQEGGGNQGGRWRASMVCSAHGDGRMRPVF